MANIGAERRAARLNDLARAALELLGDTLRSHGIASELSLTDGLPEEQADADQIGQVVLNFIVNAQQTLAAHPGPRRMALATGAHDGQVVLTLVDSGPGVAAGTAFKLTLPVAAAADSPVSTTAAAPRVAARARVLVVDDEPEIAELVRAMLESAGCEVVTADSGRAALQALDRQPFVAIVSDLRMPDIDGAALWREVPFGKGELLAALHGVLGA